VNEDEEILLAFLEESRENLDQLDRDLVLLESQPTDEELLARVFRVLHTLKGTCGFLGLTRLEALAHAGEDVLGALRAHELILSPALTTTLLHLVDTLRSVLATIESTQAEPDDDHTALVAELRAHLPHAGAPSPAVTDQEQALPDQVTAVATSESTVRVEVAVLDTLMNLVGELVLTRNRIGELAAQDDDGPLSAPYRELRGVAGELQESVMTARLQPIGTVIGKHRRIARDLATSLGKQVRVELEGEDVGVDKAVNEALRDPLLHLVRNAVDHGIEAPEERLAAGKPPVGTVRIRAFHEGGRVHVEVSDDGRGVDPTALVRRAVADGVLSEEGAAALSETEALELMFRAGMSTRTEVSTVSGRGVGMDVVRSSVEQVGGSVDVASRPGAGSQFRLNVPLTLAIMPVLVTWCGDSRFAVPQVHLREVVRLDPAQAAAQVDVVDSARLLRLRGRLVPLVELRDRLGLGSTAEAAELVVVLVESDGRRFGIVVDGVVDTIDAVVKPLPRLVRRTNVFAGSSILGDGTPCLILDLLALATAGGIAPGDADGHDDMGAAPAQVGSSLLLASAPDGGRLAVRLAEVQRLESFDRADVEHAGQTEVVQYRGELLPLVHVADVLPERREADRGTPTAPTSGQLPVIVCRTPVGPVGFVVGSIDDVVQEPPTPRQPASRRGVSACLVVQDRIAELLDLEALTVEAGIGARPGATP
jgi:two-component system, chemotaxis family, sensor kinase CheA